MIVLEVASNEYLKSLYPLAISVCTIVMQGTGLVLIYSARLLTASASHVRRHGIVSKAIHTASNLDKWASLLTNYFVPVEANEGGSPEEQIQLGTSRLFQASIYGQRWGATTLAQLAMKTHEVSRKSAVLDDELMCLKLNIQGTGRGIIMQDGKEAVLQPGEFAFLDSSRPYSVLYDGESTSQVLQFPRHLLHLPDDGVQDLSVVPFSKDNPLTKAVTSFATECSQALLTLPEPVSRRLTGNLVDLLGTVIASELYTNADSLLAADKKRRREVVIAFIEDNLDNSELSPQTIAAANFMSVRALHQLFEGTGATVATTVRSLRLERCRIELENPAEATTSISAIAARWGFFDSAHFSRAFRRTYGTTPSKWRAVQ